MSPDELPTTFTAFAGFQRVAAGTKAQVLTQLRERGDAATCLVFDDQTGEQLDVDLRDPKAIETSALEAEKHEDAPRGVGRPRLGVVAREVTLLPRHWDWLAASRAAPRWRCASWWTTHATCTPTATRCAPRVKPPTAS